VLAAIDAVDALGVDPADTSHDYWRHVHNRLTANQEPNVYTPERHAASRSRPSNSPTLPLSSPPMAGRRH